MKFLQRIIFYFGLAFTVGVIGQTSEHSDEVLVRALKEEMQRSLAELQIENEPKPYFISYVVNEGSLKLVQSILGATAIANQSSSRNLGVRVRVGSRELDNTKYIGGDPSPPVAASFPLTDSYDELRRAIWMRTDAAYKDAVSSLSAKKTAIEQQPGLERANDFSEEEPFEFVSDDPVDSVDIERMTAFANEISAVMKGHPELQHTVTVVRYVTNTRTYIDSDGNYHRLVSSLCSLRSHATAQAADGAVVHDYVSAFAGKCDEFFDNVNEIKQTHENLISSILEFVAAEPLRAYTGPVLISDEASATFFAQVFGTRAGATPRYVSEPGGFDIFNSLRNPFMDKIDARVLPNFISVINDPTKTEYEDRSLYGSYVVDNEGMPSRRTELVKDGRLQTLLMTRDPTTDFEKSTGSNRAGAAIAGNLFISSSDSVSEDELKQELLMWVEDSGNDFGILIKRFHDLSSVLEASGIEGVRALSATMLEGSIVMFPTLRAYKVNLDGSEVPVRTLSVSSFSDSQLRDIVAVSDTPRAYNVSNTFTPTTFFTGWGLGSGPGFISVVTPSVLIEELDFQGSGPGHPRLPIVTHPASE